MDRLHFIISAQFSGAERLAVWLNQRSTVLATDNRFFGHFAELWPDSAGQLRPQWTADRFVQELARRSALGLMDLDRRGFQRAFMPELIKLIVDFGLRHSQRELMVDCVSPFPGTCQAVLNSIQRYSPESGIIRIVRDGRDVLSHLAFDWLSRDAHGTDRYAYFVEKRPGLGLSRFFDDHFMTRWATWWSEVVRMGRKVEKLKDPQPLIRFEDFVANPDDALNAIESVIGMELPRFKQSAATRLMPRFQGQTLPPWRQFFTRRDGELFHELAGDILVELGYESDSNWLSDLPERLEFPSRERPEEILDGLPSIS